MPTRDWPTPEDDARTTGRKQPDLIIRDPRKMERLQRRALHGPRHLKAIARLEKHDAAIAANLHLGAALQRWRTSLLEPQS